MELILQLLIEGLLLGGFYSFMALGFALSWGVMGIINLSYGTFIVIGAYLAYTLHRLSGVDPILSIPFSFLAGVVFGYLVQTVFIRRIMTFESFMVLILTFGLDIALSHGLNLIFKADIRSIDVPYAESSFFVGTVIITAVKLLVFVISLVLTGLVWFFVNRTWTGMAIRAVALDKEGATLVGVSPSYVYTVTMALSTGIAFSSGNLYGVLQGFTPFDGGLLTVKAFLVSILGGLGRVESALIGGIFLGLSETFVGFYVGEDWKVFFALILMIAILLVKPRGLMGGKFYGEA